MKYLKTLSVLSLLSISTALISTPALAQSGNDTVTGATIHHAIYYYSETENQAETFSVDYQPSEYLNEIVEIDVSKDSIRKLIRERKPNQYPLATPAEQKIRNIQNAKWDKFRPKEPDGFRLGLAKLKYNRSFYPEDYIGFMNDLVR